MHSIKLFDIRFVGNFDFLLQVVHVSDSYRQEHKSDGYQYIEP